MLTVAFAGTFAAGLAPPVRAHLGIPCDIRVTDEAGIVDKLGDVDVLVAMAFTREMAAGARRLKLVQVPGAGLERIDRAALPAGTALANAYGHEVGIAEYVLGAMLALTRGFVRLDAALRRGAWESQWAVGTAAAAVAGAGRQDPRHSRLRAHRPGAGPARPGVRHGHLRDPS